jgi:hypothetical protein
MRILALIIGLAGLALAVQAYLAWKEYAGYTVAAEGVVSQRTPTFVAVRLDGDIPGGQGTMELAWHVISNSRSDVPPPDGPPLALGDKVSLVHPLGRPSAARLKDGFGPALPPWLGWLGVGMIVVAVAGFLVAGRRNAPT